jgi:uncharacterized membrane protein YbhN (UPF0104 family)
MEAHDASRIDEGRARLRRTLARVLPLILAGIFLIPFREQMPAAISAVRKAHPVALVSLPVFFLWNQLATLAWRGLLRAVGASPIRLGELVRLRIEAQAVNQLVPTAGVAGEALRAVRAAGGRDVGPASLATVLDNVAGLMSGLAFAACALAFHSYTESGGRPLQALMASVAGALVFSVVAAFAMFRLVPRWLPRLSEKNPLRALVGPLRERVCDIRQTFRKAVALRLLERIVAVGETYAVFHAVGAPVSLSGAALISAVLVAVSFVAFFSPGQLGAAEAATAVISGVLGFSVATGLSAALLRRARQLLVCALGLVSMALRNYGSSGRKAR